MQRGPGNGSTLACLVLGVLSEMTKQPKPAAASTAPRDPAANKKPSKQRPAPSRPPASARIDVVTADLSRDARRK